MNDKVDIVRLFSRKTFSSTVIVDKEKGIQIVAGTPVQTPNISPVQTPNLSPNKSRSRANSYDLECYNAIAKEYETSGRIYFDIKKI